MSLAEKMNTISDNLPKRVFRMRRLDAKIFLEDCIKAIKHAAYSGKKSVCLAHTFPADNRMDRIQDIDWVKECLEKKGFSVTLEEKKDVTEVVNTYTEGNPSSTIFNISWASAFRKFNPICLPELLFKGALLIVFISGIAILVGFLVKDVHDIVTGMDNNRPPAVEVK